jgi:hypothetical protein
MPLEYIKRILTAILLCSGRKYLKGRTLSAATLLYLPHRRDADYLYYTAG